MTPCKQLHCQHSDTCKHAIIELARYKPPSQRGALPDCYECQHKHWQISHSTGIRKCADCGEVRKLNEESAVIKHQRG